jgi:hypothetical protein
MKEYKKSPEQLDSIYIMLEAVVVMYDDLSAAYPLMFGQGFTTVMAYYLSTQALKLYLVPPTRF